MTQTLLVDVGNQRIKWVQLNDNKQSSNLEQIIRDTSNTIDGIDLNGFPESMPTPRRIFISSVGHAEFNMRFKAFCNEKWQCIPEMMRSPESQLGLKNSYQTPGQLGVDRWLAALAAYNSETANNIIVIDAGTAITVDLVTKGVFKGGAILPGFSTIVRTLGGDTGQIKIDYNLIMQATVNTSKKNTPIDFNIIATSSADAVKAGVLASMIGGVNYCVNQIQSKLTVSAKILITGGDTDVLAPFLNYQYTKKSNLVLHGLGLIAQEVYP